MNPALELAAFSGVMALGQFSPGPDMLLLTRTSLSEGSLAGAKMAAGIATGLILHSALALGGLAVAIHSLPLLHLNFILFAAAYLAWLGFHLIRSSRQPSSPNTSSPPSHGIAHHPYLRGLLCNILNPKAALFLAATSLPFLSSSRPPYWPWLLGAIVVIQGGTLWALWASLLQWPPLRRFYQTHSPKIDLLFGISLSLLAAKLLLETSSLFEKGKPTFPVGSLHLTRHPITKANQSNDGFL